MPWTTLYTVETILNQWVYSAGIQGMLFRLSHLSNNANTVNFRGVLGQAFIEDDNATIFDTRLLTFKEDSEAHILIKPIELASRMLAIRRLDDSVGTWDIVVEVLNGMPDYLTLPIYINQVENLQDALDSKTPISTTNLIQTTITALTTEVGTKASNTRVDTIEAVLETKASDVDVNAVELELTNKVDTTEFNALEAIVDTKADNTDIDAIAVSLNNKVGTVQFNTLETVVASKANSSAVGILEGTIATKANNSDLAIAQAAILTKLSKASNLIDVVDIDIARENIGAAKSGVNNDITQLMNLDVPPNGSNDYSAATTNFVQQIYKPAFIIHCNTTVSIGSTLTKITFPSIEIDTNSSATGNQFTVPTGFAGLYIFKANLYTLKDATAGSLETQIRVNSNAIARDYTRVLASVSNTVYIDALKYLAVGDIVSVWIRCTSGNTSLGTSDTTMSSFFGFRLGI